MKLKAAVLPRKSADVVKAGPEPETTTGPETGAGSEVPPQGGTKSARTRARSRARMAQAGVGGPEMVEAEAEETTDASPAGVESEPEPEEEESGREPRLRWALWNGTAAAAGHLVIWSVTGDPMAGADLMGRMTVSVPELAATGITLGALVAGWKGAALIHLHKLPGLFGPGARLTAALAAAGWGQGTAPVVRDLMYAVEPWGTLLAPLLAAGPVAAACWWGLDRHARQAVPAIRWLARVPLATVTLSALLYAPGVAP